MAGEDLEGKIASREIQPKKGTFSWLKRFKWPTKSPDIRTQDRPIQTDSPNEVIKVDTDDPEIRQLRIINQDRLENDLNKTFGLSFLERLALIRNDLFEGIASVRGQEITKLRDQDLNRGHGLTSINYASAYLVNTNFMPRLNKIVNSLAEQIKQIDNSKKAEAALHLASIIYSLGIPIHPYMDGNGQTLKMIALSYLHELAPDTYGNRFFPFKPTNTGENVDNNLPTPIIARLYRFSTPGIFTEEDLKREWALRAGWVKDDTLEGSHEVTEAEMNKMFPDEYSKEEFKQYYNEGWLVLQNLVTKLGGSHQSQLYIHLFLEYMLNFKEGADYLHNYVLEPDKAIIKYPDKTPWYTRTAQNFFEGISSDIKDILEDKAIHNQKFARAKIQALAPKS